MEGWESNNVTLSPFAGERRSQVATVTGVVTVGFSSVGREEKTTVRESLTVATIPNPELWRSLS